MQVGCIGRTEILLAAAREVQRAGHDLRFVHTCAAEPHYGATEADFADFAVAHGVPFSSGRNLLAQLPGLAAQGAEVVISVNWPTLVPREFRNAFTHGVLNAHAGDLPRYRGNACPNWALLNFEERVGMTIHRMEEELDAGPSLAKAFLPICESTYIGDIYEWITARAPGLFCDALGQLERGGGFLEQSHDTRPLRTFPRRPEDARICWERSTRDVLALIRASSRPFPGAFCFLEGEREVRIFRARRYIPDFDFRAVPGQVCLVRDARPVIAAGDGMIELQECEFPDVGPRESARVIGSSLRNRLT